MTEQETMEMIKRAQAAPAGRLAPYTTCTHSGAARALALPDDGATLFVSAEASMLGGVFAEGLLVHGIAVGRHGQKLTIKVVGGQPVQCFHQSDAAKSANRLMLKNTNEVTKVDVGGSIDFTYDEKAPGWRQVVS